MICENPIGAARLACGRDGCVKPATARLLIRVPQKRHAIDDQSFVQLDPKVLLCPGCLADFDAPAYLDDEIREVVRLACRPLVPDFDRAYACGDPA